MEEEPQHRAKQLENERSLDFFRNTSCTAFFLCYIPRPVSLVVANGSIISVTDN
jgi:hypothetical protein